MKYRCQSYNDFCPFCYNNFNYAIPYSYKRIPPKTNNLTVTTSEIFNENNKIHEDLRIPVLHGNVNPQVVNYINNNIKNDILEFKSEMEISAEENAVTSQSQGKKVVPVQISNIYLITYNKNNILSISIIYQQNINGKNYFIRTSYNYDLQSGESMPFRDLFRKGIDYKGIINNRIRQKIQQNSKAYFPNTLSKFKGVADDQPYYLEGNNLVTFFDFNEIAPVASDIPVVKIPLYELRDIIKPNLLRTEG
ncbi:MAG: DUF3298 and DUF4163 domain-containing protein [Bacillota bacterium]|nr:DUF3298 and DUF4163 domain-containing protein [Bacillota bacterium]